MKKIGTLIFTLLLLGTVHAQQKKVSGTVTDAQEGTPIPGVQIVVRESTIGTITNTDGKFEITASPSDILVFKYLGYKTEEVVVGEQTQITVKLWPDIETLSEIIVVGYGTQIKSKVTGNIAKVVGDEIKSIPVPSVELAIQGKAAGVFVESVTGKATSATRVRVRGATSLTGGNDPLYVIDGVPMNLNAMNQHGGAINPLATLNFNDVESVEILKDAAAAAIYGSRGANGVFLITTKKGKKGDAKFNFNYQTGVSTPSNKREFMNAEEYIRYFREAGYNADRYEERIYDTIPPRIFHLLANRSRISFKTIFRSCSYS
ncbi:MAG TPA: TonB-dependent receptor plug domain-containing protein [Salinivirgaceae bacterium]|nr:TonB-dependent receptor plug domain-containing protein [Salinivirgaceae bacterium]